jgi:hypothetical protein
LLGHFAFAQYGAADFKPQWLARQNFATTPKVIPERADYMADRIEFDAVYGKENPLP